MTVSFLAVLFSALALVPTGAHLAELVAKMRLGEAEYRTVQQIYRGWSLFGLVVFPALAATCLLAVQVRRPSAAFGRALSANVVAAVRQRA
jgi:hypothetical protein